MPRHAASSKGLRGSSVRREAGDGAPVDVRGVMPLTVAALAVSTCSRACAISPYRFSRNRERSSRGERSKTVQKRHTATLSWATRDGAAWQTRFDRATELVWPTPDARQACGIER